MEIIYLSVIRRFQVNMSMDEYAEKLIDEKTLFNGCVRYVCSQMQTHIDILAISPIRRP